MDALGFADVDPDQAFPGIIDVDIATNINLETQLDSISISPSYI